MKRIVIILSLLIAAFDVCGQKLTVEKMEVAPMDLSASTQPRNDLNGNPCGLVKVQLATAGAAFEGSVIGDVAYKMGEYWVYMPAGNYMLQLKHPNFLPLFINFRDYDIKRVESKTTYVLTLVMPQTTAVVKKQKLIVNYSPANAIVLIDSKPYQGNGRVEVELPVGSHDYQIIAMGYVTAEGSLKLNEDAPRTINETLVATTTQPQQQQSVDEFSGMTASEIADIAEDFYYGRNGKPQDYDEAVRGYRKAAEMGNAKAQSNLGYCYMKGRGVTQSYAEAVKWVRKAAEQGYASAQCNLAWFYYNGQGVSKDLNEAKSLLRKSAAQGDQYAKDMLKEYFNETLVATTTQPQQQQPVDEFSGMTASEIADIAEDFYYGRNGKPQDYDEAVKGYRKAAEMGDAKAQSNLGNCYHVGDGVTPDYDEAVKWYRKAAEQGYAKAQFLLGSCIEMEDYAEAVKWYRKSAEQGDADAQSRLGYCYNNGKGVTRDLAEAAKWYRKAAEQGAPDDQYILACYYYNGEGVTKDYAEAVKWYRKSAEQGYPWAQSALGYCYEKGLGITQSYAEAVKWYREAVEMEVADAQNNLGYCYYNGYGVTKDLDKAKELWRKSAAQGNQTAKDNLKKYFGE